MFIRVIRVQKVLITAIPNRFLSDLGHDVVPVAKIGLSRAYDSDLLRTAHEQGRIFVTRDRDFGGLVFVEDLGAGVIYLRMLPSTQNVVHQELARVLKEHSEAELIQAFVVVEPGKQDSGNLPRNNKQSTPPSKSLFIPGV